MKVIPETRRIHYIMTTTGSIHDTSAGELLVLKGSIRPVANIWALTWFIRYIHCWNLQFISLSHINL